ncbi:MAG: S46 family peptidase [Gammaproteobacteria bacterium]|nr:S46 family peptidase [Gammaproteobacteria bacterium]QOJ32133.1 MAG: S46 family peptidase [Gammaproteobacteria bacterium]
MTRRFVMAALAAAALASVAAAPRPAQADEGMWTFDQFPRDAVRSRYGVNIDQDWLDRVRRATVRIEGGCTGSVVSPSGLVLTNEHCVRDCLQRLSGPARDVAGAGFLAADRAGEERCAAEQASILERIENITAAVQAAVGDGAGPAANERRKATLTRLEQACEDDWRHRGDPHSCEAVTLYGGGQYFLYHYRRYADVRLVLAPEADIAFFGGDLDNFRFPRWDLDFALLRLYVDGRPAQTPDFLRWRRAGAAPGEAVFVAGHPGSTQRLQTVAQLRFEREYELGHWLLRAAELRGRYLQFASGGAEPARIAEAPLFSLENALKVRRNQMATLLDHRFMSAREKDEQALRTAVAADPRLRAASGAWADIDRALAGYAAFYDRYLFLERGAALQGELASAARLLVRAAIEREKPNEQRRREFSETALPQLRQELLAPQPVYPAFETLRLGYSLEKLVEYLGVDDPAVRLALGREAPRNLAARLVRDTRLADPAFREQLWNGGLAAVEAADDPLLALALRLEPEAAALRRRHDDQVEAPIRAAEERLARARFAIHGTRSYPDATFTLRLSYGAVQGWREGDHDVAPFTRLDGLYARATGQPPFRLPSRWLQAQARVNLDTPFNFTTTNDIIGGNSGSPVIDARGRLVGLIFDGNLHSIGGDYGYDAALNRAVAVHPAVMVLALGEIYGADALLRELTIE